MRERTGTPRPDDGSDSNTFTYFFREPETIDMVRDHVLLPRLSKGLSTSIWCVGCASGEEAYSLAMVLGEVEAPVEILATDINRVALAQATNGRYLHGRLKEVHPARRKRWFYQEDEHGVASPRLKDLVTFRRHDVISDPALSPERFGPGSARQWDAILCRNVLYYFDIESVERAMASMLSVLAPGGLLILGAAEWIGARMQSRIPCYAQLELTEIRGVLVRRKLEKARPRPIASVLPKIERIPPERYPPVSRGREEDGGQAPSRASEEAARRRGEDVEHLRNRGDRLLDGGRADEALQSYEKAIGQNALLPDLYLRSAVCHLLLDRIEEARNALRRSLFLDTSLWPAAWLLGDLIQDEDQKAATRYFSQARDIIEEGFYSSPAVTAVTEGERILGPFLPGKNLVLLAVDSRIKALSGSSGNDFKR